MAAQQSSPFSLIDRIRQEMLGRITDTLEQAKSTGQPFVQISHRYNDGDPNTFFGCVLEIANAMNPPPHAIAPYSGEGSGRDPHSRSIACGVIISF